MRRDIIAVSPPGKAPVRKANVLRGPGFRGPAARAELGAAGGDRIVSDNGHASVIVRRGCDLYASLDADRRETPGGEA
jgi:hypothetical protein